MASFPGPSKTITIEPIRWPAEDVPDPVELPEETPEPEPEKTPAK